MEHWSKDAFIYHIYPHGLLGASADNDLSRKVEHRLPAIGTWIDHIRELGANTLYLGPVFESAHHGYDTVNYERVDRRFGDSEDLTRLIETFHKNNIRVVLDVVFNHVGRDFPHFVDLREKGRDSEYTDWFAGLDFSNESPFEDPFSYEGWHGHLDLVKLNLKNEKVREYLFSVVRDWIDSFHIDGFRLDAADCIDLDFQKDLHSLCKSIKNDFWLMGEVVHGDYRNWANPQTLDSVTNYECYKGLYSSHNDHNYFEIAWSLNRQFGSEGMYRDIPLYNFADNHDVNRIASTLEDPRHLYPLHIILFTMPGIPSIYYGSEWGIEGTKKADSDEPLRPQLDLSRISAYPPQPALPDCVKRLSSIRSDSKALRRGSYRQLAVDSEQLAFMRESQEEKVVVLLNASNAEEEFSFSFPQKRGVFVDLLNDNEQFRISDRKKQTIPLSPNWGRILRFSE